MTLETYWLAAKYGGFIKGGAAPGPFASGDAWKSAGRKFAVMTCRTITTPPAIRMT
jgi:hypothetical protein